MIIDVLWQSYVQIRSITLKMMSGKKGKKLLLIMLQSGFWNEWGFILEAIDLVQTEIWFNQYYITSSQCSFERKMA